MTINADFARLAWGVVANAGRRSHERKPLWAHVADATGYGASNSVRLCVAAGFDPDEPVGIIGAIRCDECGAELETGDYA